MNTTVGQLLMEKGNIVVSVSPATTMHDAVMLMHTKRIGALLVVNEERKLVGIFAERDVLHRIVLADKLEKEEPVQTVMTRKVVFVTPDRTIDECMVLMTHHRIRHLPVLDTEEKVVGIVSIGDLVKHVSDQKDIMIRNLETYIEGSF